MASKVKFHIAKSLDERIKIISSQPEEFEPKFSDLEFAQILGFHYGNSTNYVGLTTDHELHHGSLSILGFVWFKSSPKEEEIIAIIKSNAKEFSSSPEGSGTAFQNLNLIYNLNDDTKTIEKRVFDYEAGCFLESQPKLSVLDDNKIYIHSPLVKMTLNIKLNINEKGGNKLLPKVKLEENLNHIKGLFAKPSSEIKLHLNNSNYSIRLSDAKDKNLTESVYEYLDIPDEVMQIGDYLPQMTKEDKKKLGEKWRNKMKSQRAPLEFVLEHSELSFTEDQLEPSEGDSLYRYKMKLFCYIHVNDSVLKSVESILFLIRSNIESLKQALSKESDGTTIEPNSLKCCTFKPTGLAHFVHSVYRIPDEAQVNYDLLRSIRASLHSNYLVPMAKPQFRYSQRILNLDFKNPDEQAGYLCNVHKDIAERSGIKQGVKSIIEGTYTYHHYLQNRIPDNGWGCAYRSLQTIISWFKHQGYIYSPDVEMRAGDKSDKTSELRRLLNREARVPSHQEIQSVLVDVGDKQHSFIGSQKWIGSQEVCYVLNHLYNLDSKFISVSSGAELVYKARDLGLHFNTQSTPVMIGGGVLAHTIIGLDFNEKNGDISYLILDPHYTGEEDLVSITKKGWCGWKGHVFWDKNSFYNLCLPQRPTGEI